MKSRRPQRLDYICRTARSCLSGEGARERQDRRQTLCRGNGWHVRETLTPQTRRSGTGPGYFARSPGDKGQAHLHRGMGIVAFRGLTPCQSCPDPLHRKRPLSHPSVPACPRPSRATEPAASGDLPVVARSRRGRTSVSSTSPHVPGHLATWRLNRGPRHSRTSSHSPALARR